MGVINDIPTVGEPVVRIVSETEEPITQAGRHDRIAVSQVVIGWWGFA